MKPDQLLNALTQLFRLGSQSLASQSLEEMLQLAADLVAKLLPADRVAIIEVDLEKKQVGFFARGGEGRDLVNTSVRFDELIQGLTGWVLAQGLTALSPKDEPDPREGLQAAERRRQTDCGAIAVAPLFFNGQILGTLTVINRPDQRNFDAGDQETLELFAAYCAVCIETTRMLVQQRKLEEELRNQVSWKDHLFTVLAHDLRGPVGNMAQLFQLIEMTTQPREREELIQIGIKSTQQTYSLLENILGWIRGQRDGRPQILMETELEPTLKKVQEWLDETARMKRITLEVDAAPGLVLMTDRNALLTVIRNLASNAIKYSPPDGRVILRAFPFDGGLQIEVQDFGAGISPEKRTHLFGHDKIDSAPGTAGEVGHGLGLMFCGDLARSLGWELGAESSAAGGSTFRVKIPVQGQKNLP